MELVDMRDLGGVTSAKVLDHKQRQDVPAFILAGMMELVDMRDLGAVTSVKGFLLHYLPYSAYGKSRLVLLL